MFTPYIIKQTDTQYPYHLRCMPQWDQPKELYCLGNVGLLLSERLVGFTGTETPTKEAENNVYSWAYMLVQHGYTVVSGGCSGIDTAVHKAAVHANREKLEDDGKPYGHTIVVFPHSLNKKDVYEEDNRALFNEIVEGGGLVITEYETGNVYGSAGKYYKKRFLARNRIIAGMSLVTYAWQWPKKQSGTQSTINHARRLKRQVYVPYVDDGIRENEQGWGNILHLNEHPDDGFYPESVVDQVNTITRLEQLREEAQEWVRYSQAEVKM